MDNKVSLGSNTVFNGIKSLFGIIYPLITFPYIARVLMAENVGKINFGSSVVSYFSLIASLGVATYAVRECAKIRENQYKLAEVAGQILSINLLSTILSYIALAITLFIARPLENYRVLICIQSSSIIFTTLGADWINTAMEDFKFIALRTVGMQISSLLLMFAFVHKPEDYIIYVIISVIASSGANIINILYRQRFCKIKFTFNMNLKRHLLPIFFIFAASISQTIYANSDMTMLGLFKGDYHVGVYSLAVKIYILVNTMIGGTITPVLAPRMALLYSNDRSSAESILNYGINFIIILAMPCILGINYLSKYIVFIIGGEQYLSAALPLQILTISLVFSMLGGFYGNLVLIPLGMEKVILLSSIVAAICNVVLNLIFIPVWGINAAASTTAFSEFVSFCILYSIGKNEHNLKNNVVMLIKPAIGAISMLIVIMLVLKLIKDIFWGGIISIIFGGLFYGIVLLLLKDKFILSFINDFRR